MSKNKKTTGIFGDFYVCCPWCEESVYIIKINCSLFLHGGNLKTGKMINPHKKRDYIEDIRKKGILIGCGGKFKLKIRESEIKVIMCD